MSINQHILNIGLRSTYGVMILGALSAAYILEFSFAALFLVSAALIVLLERWMDMHSTISELRSRSDEAIHISVDMSTMIAEQQKATSVMQQRADKFRKAFDHAATGMAIVSTSGEILRLNSALKSIIGFNDNELKSADFETLLPGCESAAYRRELAKLFYGAVNSIQTEQRLLRSNGDTVWVMWTASLIPATGDEPAQYIFQFLDINEKKLAERRLAIDALHDGLTGLPNRTLFIERLQVAFRSAKRRVGTCFAVCFLDFDRFDVVNDTFGHSVGDKLLVEVANRLRSLATNGVTFARTGGDEFAILIEEIDDLEVAVMKCESIRSAMARPFDINENRIQSTVSIGIAAWSPDYERPELLLRDADTALSHAKHTGRDRCEVFSYEMREAANRFLDFEADLRGAMEREEFWVYYQPIVDLKYGELAGFEALIRWNHPERGLVSPGEFISIAEENGLIFPIGEWILEQACRQLATWKRAYPEARNLWVAVNVSAKQFMQTDIEGLVAQLLDETGLPPTSLKLELTETAMADNLEHTADVMRRLKELGVRLSIDDFGTGYSSLSNLHLLPLNSLKIDRSFVNHMTAASENREIIKTIVSLASSLGLDVVAEGVETEEQLHLLRELKCDQGQGFYFAPPLDAAGAEAVIGYSRMAFAVSSQYSVMFDAVNDEELTPVG